MEHALTLCFVRTLHVHCQIRCSLGKVHTERLRAVGCFRGVGTPHGGRSHRLQPDQHTRLCVRICASCRPPSILFEQYWRSTPRRIRHRRPRSSIMLTPIKSTERRLPCKHRRGRKRAPLLSLLPRKLLLIKWSGRDLMKMFEAGQEIIQS